MKTPALALALVLLAPIARADPLPARPWARRSTEWVLLATGAVSVGPDAFGLATGFETALRYEHFFLGGDLSYQGRSADETRAQAGAWTGVTFGAEPRWEFSLGLGWHQYLSARGSSAVAYATLRAGLRWRWAGAAAWTFGAAAYLTEDLATHPLPATDGCTSAACGIELGAVLRVGFSLGG